MAKDKYVPKPEDLSGKSIYHDGKRTIYSPFYASKGYIITDKNLDEYLNYVQGSLISLIVFFIALLIMKKPLVPIILAVLFFCMTRLMFYRNFLRKAAVIENYHKPKKEGFVARQAASLDYKNIWTIIVTAPLLAFFIMLNTYINHFEGTVYWIMTVCAFAALFYAILHIMVLFYKKKHSK